MILILALMILLVLSALSFAAVQSVSNTMARAGSYRTGMIAYGITSAGSEATMSVAARDPSGFRDFIAAHGDQVAMGDVSNIFFDVNPDGSFGRELPNVGGVNWTTQFVEGNSTPAYGFDIDTYCFAKFFATTHGVYGNDTVATRGDIIRNSNKRFLSSILVGPEICYE